MNFAGILRSKIGIFLSAAIFLLGCVIDQKFDPPEIPCEQKLEANVSFEDVKNLYVDGTIQILEDLVIEGYVISSDEAGNFFNTLHFQDRPHNPTEGFQIDMEVRDSHLFYETGSKIIIKLKGLYLGESRGVYKLGGVFTAFGNVSVGRLPAAKVEEHIFLSCDTTAQLQPATVSIENLKETMVNTLVRLEDVEIIAEELDEPYAQAEEETSRTLTDCRGNEINLLNSGFSDFHATVMPAGNGSITGVLYRDRSAYQLIIRAEDDMVFLNERCGEDLQEHTSAEIFISELADPDNNSGARFAELYNAGEAVISLEGWSLRRYTNGNFEVSSTLDLSGLTIASQGTLVISPNAQEFEAVYGFSADLGVGKNSPADSNGDDNLELTDPLGKIIDTFGVPGEDGSGTAHEFEDGRAERKSGIIKGNPIFSFEEWTIYNDTGGAGTQKLPQNAPEDFTPGKR